MTPLHSQIKSALLPVMLETTQKAREMRDKLNKPKDDHYKQVEAAIRTLEKVWMDNIGGNLNDKSGWGKANRALLETVMLISGKPELTNILKANGSYAPLDPLTVLIPMDVSEDAASYGILSGMPWIVVHGIDKTLLASDGHMVDKAYDPGAQYKSFPASDLEVEQCLDNLTAAQLRAILGDELFMPYLEEIFGAQAEPPPAKPEDEIQF